MCRTPRFLPVSTGWLFNTTQRRERKAARVQKKEPGSRPPWAAGGYVGTFGPRLFPAMPPSPLGGGGDISVPLLLYALPIRQSLVVVFQKRNSTFLFHSFKCNYIFTLQDFPCGKMKVNYLSFKLILRPTVPELGSHQFRLIVRVRSLLALRWSEPGHVGHLFTAKHEKSKEGKRKNQPKEPGPTQKLTEERSTTGTAQAQAHSLLTWCPPSSSFLGCAAVLLSFWVVSMNISRLFSPSAVFGPCLRRLSAGNTRSSQPSSSQSRTPCHHNQNNWVRTWVESVTNFRVHCRVCLLQAYQRAAR